MQLYEHSNVMLSKTLNKSWLLRLLRLPVDGCNVKTRVPLNKLVLIMTPVGSHNVPRFYITVVNWCPDGTEDDRFLHRVTFLRGK